MEDEKKENLTPVEFYIALDKYRKQYPHLRKGQAVFNLMESLRPVEDIDRLRGTLLDPFYNDEVVDDFINAIL